MGCCVPFFKPQNESDKNHFDGAMTNPKRKRKRDDSNNTTSSQSSIERIIKPDYTNLNDEEKKGITVLDREEEEYVIFLSAISFLFVFLFLDVQLTLSIFSFSFPFLSLARKVSERKRTEII